MLLSSTRSLLSMLFIFSQAPFFANIGLRKEITQNSTIVLTIEIALLIIILILFWKHRKQRRENKELRHAIKAKDFQIQENATRIKEMDRITSQFLNNVSHELKTPITAIMLAVSMLIQRESKPSTEVDLKTIKRNAEKLLALVNQLVDLSLSKKESAQLDLEHIDVLALVYRLTRDFSEFAKDKKITITFNKSSIFRTPTHGSIWADIDRVKLTSVVSQLLSNAIKFNFHGGTIDIDVCRHVVPAEDSPGEFVSIQIKNTGPKIPPQSLPYIFDQFYQVEMADDRTYEGTGTGLALVREYIQLHSGNIEVNSSETITNFLIKIPSRQVSFQGVRNENEKEAINQDVITSSQLKILIADSNDGLRTFIKRTLQPHFFIMEASNSYEAFLTITKVRPDIVIADISLDEVDGFPLTKYIRSHQTLFAVPVMLMSSNPEHQEKLKALQMGANDYLSKPFQAAELIERVNYIAAKCASVQA